MMTEVALIFSAFAFCAWFYFVCSVVDFDDRKVVTCESCKEKIFVEDADLVSRSVSGAYTEINFYHCKTCWRDQKVVTCRTCQKRIFVEDADLVSHLVLGAGPYTKINFYHCKTCWR